MADPVGVVALSLTCLHGCVKGLVVLSKAKHYNRDVSDVRLQTELTLHSLFTWAEEAGLTQEPPTLLMSANKAALVPKILGQLETLLLDLKQLEQRYELYLQPTSDDVETLHEDDSTLGQMGPQQQQCTKRADVAIFRKRKEPWKRLRWVTLDDKKFDRLLDKAKGYVSEVEKFLEQAKQERRDRYLEFCLRQAILNFNGQQELAIIDKEYGKAPSKLAIAAAARLKQTRLKLGFSDWTPDPAMTAPSRSVSTSTMVEKHCPSLQNSSGVPSKDMKLSIRPLTLSRAQRAQPLRTLAHYEDRLVLLEWKNVPSMRDPIISGRVNQVAALLQDLGPMFHSLPCRGFVKDRLANRYGYVFDLPDELCPPPRPSQPPTQDTCAGQPVPELRSLRQMLDQPGAPSLNMRLSLAVKMLETLLNLHTSGWLHKQLGSSNIILIRGADYGNAATNDELPNHSVYIGGYVFSRVDSPGEMTEPMKPEVDADLYRHPSQLGDAREPYRKSLDIFSVGCTLLEIGLWSSLRQILEHHSPTGAQSAVFSSPERSKSVSTVVRGIASQEANHGEADVSQKPRLDFMKLKHELLLPHLTVQRPGLGKAASQKSSLTGSSRSRIMRSLEAATGELYASVVEMFLAADDTIKATNADEHEFALDIEMKARDTVQAIAQAI